MLFLSRLALGISVSEVLGAGALFPFLWLLGNPSAESVCLPVRLLAGLLPIDDLRQLSFTVAGFVLVFFAAYGTALVGRAYVEQRIVMP